MIRNYLFIVLFIFLIVNVSGLGVSPAKSTFIYSPGMEKAGVIKIYNSEGLEGEVTVTVQGRLSKYIDIADNVYFNEGEKFKEIKYILKIDEDMAAGDYESVILLEQKTSGEGLIETNVIIESKIVLKVISEEVVNEDFGQDSFRDISVFNNIEENFNWMILFTGFLTLIFIISLVRFIVTHRNHKKIHKAN